MVKFEFVDGEEQITTKQGLALDLNETKRNLTRKCLIYNAIRDFAWALFMSDVGTDFFGTLKPLSLDPLTKPPLSFNLVLLTFFFVWR
jgi:hypothetical protein